MGIFHLGGGGGGGGPVTAADVSFDNDYSGLDATDLQAATDELSDEKLNVPGFVLWENLDWETLIYGGGAPSSGTGGDGWFYLDTTPGSEALYGPSTFDPGIPGWDWGSPLANFVFSTNGPSSEAGDWYVWDDNGTYGLFQKKTQINYGDMLFWNNTAWEARSKQFSAQNVYADLSAIDTAYGVDSVKTQLQNLFANYAQAYNGGNSYFVETNIAGTHTVNPYDGNAHVLTITDDTTISFASYWDPTTQLGTRYAELTVILIQDNTGGHSVSWSGNIWWNNNEHNVSTGAGHTGIWKFISYDNGDRWFGHRWGNNFQD